jgi:hypothetical protein
MSLSEIERFTADLKSNAALRAEAERARANNSAGTPLQRAVAFAASKGYAFTADELKEHAKANANAAGKQLTDAELDGVTAGAGEQRGDWNQVIDFFQNNDNPTMPKDPTNPAWI